MSKAIIDVKRDATITRHNHQFNRARLVGREIKTNQRPDLFAATPPLESLRMIFSICASHQDDKDPYRILSSDIKRAYFFAKAKRLIFIEIPAEDRVPGDENKIGRLNLSLYGTRDAAMNWQDEFISTLVANGFLKGKASPCNFFHPQRNLCVIVHGDDFTSTGPKKQLMWFKELLDKAYECKHHWLGPDDSEERSIRVLNRVICWAKDSITYEADARHVEVVLNQLQLNEAKSVTSPGTREEQTKANETTSDEMKPDESSRYRMLVARLNYLSSDRPDIQYAVKEASKHMSKPHIHHWGLLKRIGKYLIDAPRVIQKFKWQGVMNVVSGHSDSDWAGDRQTRKSTSGGVCRIGPHVIKTWSSTQQMIALSSAEAELYALLKCACQTLGIMNLALDFGIRLQATVHTDASAALAISQRQGLGKLRHIDVHWLWLQERIKNGDIAASKVKGTENPADLMTKHLSGPEINQYLVDMDFEKTEGRADKSLTLNNVAHDNGADYWTTDSQCVIVHHQTARRNLCDPFQCAGAPRLGTLTSTRVTHGMYDDGTEFTHQDNWTCKSTKRLDMGKWWTGRTVFVPKMTEHNPGKTKSVEFIDKPQYIGSVSSPSMHHDSFWASRDLCARACAAASPKPGRYPLPSTSDPLNVSQVSVTQYLSCQAGNTTIIDKPHDKTSDPTGAAAAPSTVLPGSCEGLARGAEGSRGIGDGSFSAAAVPSAIPPGLHEAPARGTGEPGPNPTRLPNTTNIDDERVVKTSQSKFQGNTDNGVMLEQEKLSKVWIDVSNSPLRHSYHDSSIINNADRTDNVSYDNYRKGRKYVQVERLGINKAVGGLLPTNHGSTIEIAAHYSDISATDSVSDNHGDVIIKHRTVCVIRPFNVPLHEGQMCRPGKPPHLSIPPGKGSCVFAERSCAIPKTGGCSFVTKDNLDNFANDDFEHKKTGGGSSNGDPRPSWLGEILSRNPPTTAADDCHDMIIKEHTSQSRCPAVHPRPPRIFKSVSDAHESNRSESPVILTSCRHE